MPIVEPAPYRIQYFENDTCPPDIFIPADDPEAWAWNPRHRWVFDKLAIALSQGLDAGPHGLEPSAFPVFSKPIINFRGMGIGSRVIRSSEELRVTYEAGHMWMPVQTGDHVSTDLAVLDGEPLWIRHATGRPTHGGMFDYWTVHASAFPALTTSLEVWTRTNLTGYSGILNTETIGGTIIEAHLRFSDQWPDLYGPGWVAALIELYAGQRWRFADSDRQDGYSLALFGPHKTRFRHPPAALVSELLARSGISSIQITFREERAPEEHGNPPGGFRLALVNATDLAAGQLARAELARWFGVG